MTELEPFVAPQLVLVEIAAGAAVVQPAGLAVGEAIPISAQVQGRWLNVGAGPDQDLMVRDEPQTIGRVHARLTERNGAILLQGRLQKKGYALNGVRYNDCTARPLKEGDLITLGENLTFRFEAGMPSG